MLLLSACAEGQFICISKQKPWSNFTDFLIDVCFICCQHSIYLSIYLRGRSFQCLLAWMDGFFFSFPGFELTDAISANNCGFSVVVFTKEDLWSIAATRYLKRTCRNKSENIVHGASHFDMNKALVAERGAQRGCWRKLGKWIFKLGQGGKHLIKAHICNCCMLFLCCLCKFRFTELRMICDL